METVIAVLLGMAAILTAVTSYQGAIKGGDSIKEYNNGIRSTNDANGFYNDSTAARNRDQALFLEFAKATQADNEELAEYVKSTLMDENLSGAIEEYVNDDTDKIKSPLEAPSYADKNLDEANKLSDLTERQFASAQDLDDKGDKYDLVTVILAVSLFFLGIAGVMSSWRIKLTGTFFGLATLVASTAMWLTV